LASARLKNWGLENDGSWKNGGEPSGDVGEWVTKIVERINRRFKKPSGKASSSAHSKENFITTW
jgi:hypothetical protein